MKKLTIAIDGPSGAGKSTVARAIAGILDYTYIDTGAMYRAVALRSVESGVPLDDVDGMVTLADEMDLRFENGPDRTQRVFVQGRDVSADLRTAEVTRLSSPVSAISGVRRVLVELQQRMGAGGGVVMEGRDIGTVVFPNADVKIFLTATEKERAIRRWRERTVKGEDVTIEQTMLQQRERDTRDSSREDSPLLPAEDAILLDSNGMDFDQVVNYILDLCRQKEGAAS